MTLKHHLPPSPLADSLLRERRCETESGQRRKTGNRWFFSAATKSKAGMVAPIPKELTSNIQIFMNSPFPDMPHAEALQKPGDNRI